jgi:hypothetical protein
VDQTLKTVVPQTFSLAGNLLMRIPVRSWAFQRGVSVTVAGGLVAVLLGQFTAPILGNTACGLIVPHEHILIGQADEHDLQEHLAAEAKCAAGKPDAPAEQSSELKGNKGHILQVIRFDGRNAAYLAIPYYVTADLPVTEIIQYFRSLYSLLEQTYLLGESVSIPPPKLPPKSA